MQIHRVALWGNVGCGKDTWAAALPLAAEQVGLSLRPLDGGTVAWQADTRVRMATGDFPHATDLPRSAADLRLLSYVITDHRPRSFLAQRNSILVQIPQAAGGWWSDPHVQREWHTDMPDPYQYLVFARGIICLLDPSSLEGDDVALSLMAMLDYLDLSRRRLKRRQPVRIALWLTKMDMPEHRRQQSQEQQYARALFGTRLAGFLARYGKIGEYEFRWGGCSAIGMLFHGGRWRSNAYWDYSVLDYSGRPMAIQRILDPRAIQPENVLEPLYWVLEPALRGR